MSDPQNLEAAKQALLLLQRVRAKVLLELWTTLMFCAGMLSVVIAQIFLLFGFRRIAHFFIGVFGYAMTWVPAAIAPPIGYGIIIIAVASIVKDSLDARRPAIKPAIKPAQAS